MSTTCNSLWPAQQPVACWRYGTVVSFITQQPVACWRYGISYLSSRATACSTRNSLQHAPQPAARATAYGVLEIRNYRIFQHAPQPAARATSYGVLEIRIYRIFHHAPQPAARATAYGVLEIRNYRIFQHAPQPAARATACSTRNSLFITRNSLQHKRSSRLRPQQEGSSLRISREITSRGPDHTMVWRHTG